MRDINELLRSKEQELQRLRKQVEALRIAAPLLGEEEGRPVPVKPESKKLSN